MRIKLFYHSMLSEWNHGNAHFLRGIVAELRRPGLDVDALATLHYMETNAGNPFRQLVPEYDLIHTYGGGEPVKHAYRQFDAKKCIPIYNALDPETHQPTEAKEAFKADLAFMGNRLPDREKRVDEFFFNPAALLPQCDFLLGGNGWQDKPMPNNIKYTGHVYTRDHNAFSSTPLAVLNISRESMAKTRFSPAKRVFEAAGLLESLSRDQAREIGRKAKQRVLQEHTYQRRA